MAIAYQFPSPTDRAAWEESINAAIAVGTLRWTHIADQQWRLDGACPRCGDPFGQYFDFEVIVPRELGAHVFTAGTSQVTTQVVCLCEIDPPHRKDTKGCGAGKSLEIALATPQPPAGVG